MSRIYTYDYSKKALNGEVSLGLQAALFGEKGITLGSNFRPGDPQVGLRAVAWEGARSQ